MFCPLGCYQSPPMPGATCCCYSAEPVSCSRGTMSTRELTQDAVEHLIKELESGGLDVQQYDLGQLILMWEKLHPELISNPTGHGNLYRIADSFSELLKKAKPHPNAS